MEVSADPTAVAQSPCYLATPGEIPLLLNRASISSATCCSRAVSTGALRLSAFGCRARIGDPLEQAVHNLRRPLLFTVSDLLERRPDLQMPAVSGT